MIYFVNVLRKYKDKILIICIGYIYNIFKYILDYIYFDLKILVIVLGGDGYNIVIVYKDNNNVDIDIIYFNDIIRFNI